MSSPKKRLLNSHVKNYVDTIFSNSLYEANFTNYEDRSITWFRLKNQEVIHTVIFKTLWIAIPIFLDISYSTRPLFSDLCLSRSAYSDCCHYEDGIPLSLTSNFMEIYSEEIPIVISADRGLDSHLIDEIILPKMESVNSLADCYHFHKQTRIETHIKEPQWTFCDLTPTFIDEAIYMDDQEMYPHCLKVLNRRITSMKETIPNYPNDQKGQKQLEQYELMQRVIRDGGRKEYLEILERRKAKNLSVLRKYFELRDGKA